MGIIDLGTGLVVWYGFALRVEIGLTVKLRVVTTEINYRKNKTKHACPQFVHCIKRFIQM